MRRAGITAAVLAALAGCVAPSVCVAAAPDRPIVYMIVLDGLDGDRVDAGRAPFISSLLAGQDARSTYYRESRSVMVAETNPNHSAMITGAYGSSSGIPGNVFALYSPLEGEDSCAPAGPVDESRAPTETSGESAGCLEAESVFEAVKRQGNPDGLLTAGIFGKPKLGRIFAGRRVDGRNRDADYLWAPCDGSPDEDDYCGDVPLNPANGYALDDSVPMDQVISTIRNGVGAERRRPDFTFVNLHQIDSAGHATGTNAAAYDVAIGQADDQIERLVTELRARGEWQRTVMILLSDHSMDTTPSKTTLTSSLTDQGIPEDAFVPVQNGSVDMLYLADRTSAGRFELLKRMRAAALATPGVAEALYREPNPADGGGAHSLDGVHPGWHVAGPRTGDLFVTHTAGGAFSDPGPTSNPLPGNHGGPQTRDNFFAVVGGGASVEQMRPPGTAGPLFDDTFANPFQAENVDPAATIMGLFGLSAPRDSQGRFLGEAFDGNALPGGARPTVKPRVRVRVLANRVPKRRIRSRSACRRLRKRPVKLAIAVDGPAESRYNIVARRTGFRRFLRRASGEKTATFRLRPGRRMRFRGSLAAASGINGPVGGRLVRTRRVRCARR